MTFNVDLESLTRQAPVHVSLAHQKVIDYIESTFDHIIQEIQVRPYGKPVITLKRITAIKPYYDHSDYMRLKWHIEDRPISYSFPGKNKDEAWRFACLGRVLGEIYAAVQSGILVTKRDIYYHDPSLFKHQGLVDRLVDDIAHTCGVRRMDLHVVASPKGLVAGFKNEVITIPDMFPHAHLDALGHVKWILVVEKEATLKALVEQSFHLHPTLGSGIIVTAKGYPDLSTRKFLRMVCDGLSPPVPLWGLFDLDPDGMRILKCYL
ncbi:hypothetical protein B0A52_10148 [Exophiala mesophila]|uniref:DNA topoisomerase (ATP-hydrolyzing) n=1 Tax=Exophiala mesophila TaxID=212818 RepID=A0A438MRF9_EXOME|nr:hypothetical protein B0A52_10148 [Exophiala mesophila]